MTGHSTPSQPPGNTSPPQDLQAARAPGPSQPAAGPPWETPARTGQALQAGPAPDTTPAGAGASAGVDPPGPGILLGTPPDPAAASGPPWPRLVATGGGYTPPRLLRWPVVLGTVLFVGWIAATVSLRIPLASLPSPAAAALPDQAAPYFLTPADAHFTATFPGKPQRTTQALGTITAIAYIAQLSSHAVAVTYLPLPAAASFSFNGAIRGAAASLPAGKVVATSTVTYLGQPARDAAISSSAGFAQIRVVRFGSSAFILEGFGAARASFAHDYQILLRTFTPRS